jgi:hypothetical protein
VVRYQETILKGVTVGESCNETCVSFQ